MRITIHVGLHKTGTTYIQSAMDVAQKIDRSTAYITPGTAQFQELKSSILKCRNGSLPDTLNIKNIAESFVKIYSNIDHMVISDENLIGAPPLSISTKKDKTIYANLESQISLLKTIFSNHKIKFAVTYKDFPRFVKSLYLDGLGYLRYTASLDEYVNQHDIRSFHPLRIISRIEKEIGEEVIKIDSSTPINPDTMKAIGLLSQNVDLSKINLPRINQSMSPTKASIFRLFGNLPYEQKRTVKRWISECPVEINNIKTSVSDVSFSEEVLERLRKIDAEEGEKFNS